MPPIFQSAAGQLNVWVEQRALLITWVVLGAAAAAMAQRARLHKDGRIQRHGAQGADEPGQGGAQLRPGDWLGKPLAPAPKSSRAITAIASRYSTAFG